jgi:probable rRNA maturation factor
VRDRGPDHPGDLDIEIVGASAERAPGAPTPQAIRTLCDLTLASAGIRAGHLAIEFVDEQRIASLNAQFRGRPEPTDVLSFPVDEGADSPGPRELGDVIICAARAESVAEAIVHGVLHLCGMDHEVDEGEMLVLQSELLRWHAADAEPLAAAG